MNRKNITDVRGYIKIPFGIINNSPNDDPVLEGFSVMSNFKKLVKYLNFDFAEVEFEQSSVIGVNTMLDLENIRKFCEEYLHTKKMEIVEDFERGKVK